MTEPRPTRLGRALLPVHRWVWRDADRSARKLLAFAAVEADGARELARAAALTPDPLLRRLFLRHAADEQRHAELLRGRGRTVFAALGPHRRGWLEARWLAPGEREFEELHLGDGDVPLLAFLHVSERAATRRFAQYVAAVSDPLTRETFVRILADEVFHAQYTRAQLERIGGGRHRSRIWRARAARLWRAYLRAAAALAGALGTVVLLAQYFLVLPAFALLARRAARREPPGWHPCAPSRRPSDLASQY